MRNILLCAVLTLIFWTSHSTTALPVRPLQSDELSLTVICPHDGRLHCSITVIGTLKESHREKLYREIDDWIDGTGLFWGWIIEQEEESEGHLELRVRYFGF